MTYQGRTNRGTWLLKLYIDNTSELYHYFRSLTIATVRIQGEEQAKRILADIIGHGLKKYLVTWLLEEINYNEIAEELIEEHRDQD